NPIIPVARKMTLELKAISRKETRAVPLPANLNGRRGRLLHSQAHRPLRVRLKIRQVRTLVRPRRAHTIEAMDNMGRVIEVFPLQSLSHREMMCRPADGDLAGDRRLRMDWHRRAFET